jgi:hypothetical protein
MNQLIAFLLGAITMFIVGAFLFGNLHWALAIAVQVVVTFACLCALGEEY